MQSVLTWLGQRLAKGPDPQARYASVRVGLVSDDLTSSALAAEVRTVHLTPQNFRAILTRRQVDFVFVESAWLGYKKSWQYKIASYPSHPDRTNEALIELVHTARDAGIPCMFWNKEDSVHFERFIDSARWFSAIYTVDENTLPRYAEATRGQARLGVLPFAVQPRIHDGQRRADPVSRLCFVGSYTCNMHFERKARQEMLFSAASAWGLDIFDRNSRRRNHIYRYPSFPRTKIYPAVSYERTPRIYQEYVGSLNVNTVEDSRTMFSRRLVEIMASGGLAITTPSASVSHLFKDCCHVVHSRSDAVQLFERLSRGRSPRDAALISHGREVVFKNHLWVHRLQMLEEDGMF